MAEFDVDPDRMRQTARDVMMVAAGVGALARHAAGLAQTGMRQHFPALPEAQEAAERWDEAQAVFATGISRIALALDGLSDKLVAAADAYEAADAHAVQRNEAIREQSA